MKLSDKLEILQTKHMGEWLKTRREMADSLSDALPMFCICGRLATGLHESSCRKFNDKVTEDTVRKLEHLLTA
jgi:hypothetical protein